MNILSKIFSNIKPKLSQGVTNKPLLQADKRTFYLKTWFPGIVTFVAKIWQQFLVHTVDIFRYNIEPRIKKKSNTKSVKNKV